MPKVSQAYMDARRQQILTAAVACFARRGIHSSSMQDICRESGLSPGAIYRHFSGKAEIIEEVFTIYSNQVGDMWERISEYDDVLEGILAMLELSFSWFDDPAAKEGLRQGILMHAEALFDDNIAQKSAAMHTGFVQQLTHLVRTAQAQGSLNPSLDPEAVARLLFSLYDGFRMQKMMEDEVDTEPYLALLRALLRGERIGVPKA